MRGTFGVASGTGAGAEERIAGSSRASETHAGFPSLLARGVGLAAFEEYEAAVAVVGSEDGFEVQRVALMGLPDVGGHYDEAGGSVAETALENGCVAIEIEQQRRDLFLKSVNVERVGGRDDAGDFFGGGPE